MRRRERGLAAP